MENNVSLEINNFGPIAHADININKLNIVGGQNSTGKSTASKLLYCFLRANSYDKQSLIMDSLINQISRLESRCLRLIRLNRNRTSSIRRFRRFYSNDDFDLEGIINYYESLKNEFDNLVVNNELDSDRVQKTIEESYKIIDIIDDMIKIILEDSYDLYFSMMDLLLKSEFDIFFKKNVNKVDNGIKNFNSDSYSRIYGEDLEYLIDFENECLSATGLIDCERIYFIDSLSIFDSFVLVNSETEHNKNLKSALFNVQNTNDLFDNIVYEDTKNIENNFDSIINGHMKLDDDGLNFYCGEEPISMKNTSSGIKQMAVLQLLLKNRKLTSNTFLILDEPEVHLHSEWLIQLARLLVYIAKYLDVYIYINTHSPMFIEALFTYSEYFDFEDYTNYYISENSEVENKYDFIQLDSSELYKIYESLGAPYDELDSIRLGKEI